MSFSLGMTAIAVSPNRRYVAVAERGEKPTVTIFDLFHDQSKKKKVGYEICAILVIRNCSVFQLL